MLHMPTTMLMGGLAPPLKSYAQFQAHIAERATGGDRAWGSRVAYIGQGSVINRTTVGAPIDHMYGSPWGGFFNGAANNPRMVQHCFPSEAAFLAAAGLEVLFKWAFFGIFESSAPGRNRNGYQSLDDLSETDLYFCDEFLFYVPDVGAFRMNPRSSLGPLPYDWSL